MPAAGRQRPTCPFRRSPASGRRYPTAKASGHSAFEAKNVDTLVRATDGFA
ncbi:hypothetical protein ACUDTJ_01085 [Stenotrophomonas pavanii]|uniref:hypothetical protein n=1 Tax=Stenotrophomonas pavanii TaxID=487698 RepID=UPI000ADF8550|nr:hypothetical protein [Stenotrophomonas pavanii]MCU1121464.1 hypothetical protein [Stenotrophomonas maltophilia]